MKVHNDTDNHKPLKTTLLTRIEEEQVQPRSRTYFRCRECGIWTLWLVSVIVGGLAVAISAFVVTHHQYAMYEATHDNFLTFLVEVLPYIWLLIFGVMAVSAVYNLRHTRHGYRYPVSVILASSVVLSFAAGSALQFFGLGYTIDAILGQQMGVYMSQEKVELRLWQQPMEGRLVGQQVLTTLSPTTTVVFEDAVGQRWRLQVAELPPVDQALLAAHGQVRVLGQVVNAPARIFHACGVFPWMMDKHVSRHDMSSLRQAFVERGYGRNQQVSASTATDSTAVNRPIPSQVCADIAAARRISAESR